MVTAELPAFSRQGDKIKVKVSTIGDAKSIDNALQRVKKKLEKCLSETK